MGKVAVSVDVTKCTGCRGCQVACKQWNGLSGVKTGFSGSYENPPKVGGTTWTKVKFVEEQQAGGKVRFLFRKIQCMHCTEASCIEVCPAGAISKQDNGTTLIDQERCIGCKNCNVACPFGAVGFDPAAGVSRKCWLCQNRLENDMPPACVKACPPGAVQSGDRDVLLAKAKVRVNELKAAGKDAYLYGEKELGGLNVLYVLDAPPKVYGLPENPKLATAGVFGSWASVLVGAGILALAPFKLLFSDKEADITKTPGTGVDQNASS